VWAFSRVCYVSKPSGLKDGDKRYFAGEVVTLYYDTFSETKKWTEPICSRP